jgi:hypothetical protein
VLRGRVVTGMLLCAAVLATVCVSADAAARPGWSSWMAAWAKAFRDPSFQNGAEGAAAAPPVRLYEGNCAGGKHIALGMSPTVPSAAILRLPGEGEVKHRDQPRMRDESTAASTDASNTASPGLDAAEPLTPAEQVVVSGVRAADSAHEDSGPKQNHRAAKCEYEPTQRPLPPPSLATCDVASASSRSSTAGSSTPQQGHSLSRLLTKTLSLRATSPSGKRCIPSL